MHVPLFGASSLTMLTERFDEMDWNHDGHATFKEFLLAFEGWVGLEDDGSFTDEASSPQPSEFVVKSASMIVPGTRGGGGGGGGAGAFFPGDRGARAEAKVHGDDSDDGGEAEDATGEARPSTVA